MNSVLIIIGGLGSYVGVLPSLLGYLIVGVALAGLLALPNAKLLSADPKLNWLSGAYAVASFISFGNNALSGYPDALQTVIYPVAFYILCTNAHLFFRVPQWCAWIVLAIFLINGLVALGASVFGLRQLPFLGEIPLNRYIFFTQVRSSAGLLWNVNYYAASQACGFWLLLIFGQNLRPHSRIFLIGTLLVGSSVILGSSRSVTTAFAASIAAYAAFKTPPKYLPAVALAGASAIWIIQFGSHSLDLDAIARAFRFERGLNSRTAIWEAASLLFQQRPLVGLTSPSRIAEEMLAAGSPTTAVQNGFMLTALRLGILGLIPVIGIVSLALTRGAATARDDTVSLLAFCGFLVVLIDSFVRSYSLGGVGFVPLSQSAFLGIILLRHRNASSAPRLKLSLGGR